MPRTSWSLGSGFRREPQGVFILSHCGETAMRAHRLSFFFSPCPSKYQSRTGASDVDQRISKQWYKCFGIGGLTCRHHKHPNPALRDFQCVNRWTQEYVASRSWAQMVLERRCWALVYLWSTAAVCPLLEAHLGWEAQSAPELLPRNKYGRPMSEAFSGTLPTPFGLFWRRGCG